MAEFFGGFALKDPDILFEDFFKCFNLKLNKYDVCGFDFGAQKAIKYTLDSTKRINRLILLSPVFFNGIDYDFMNYQLFMIKKRGIIIFVFLGGRDKVINISNSIDIFKRFGIVYLLKSANHLLKKEV